MEKIPKTNHDKVKELSDKIKEGVKDFYQSDTWKKYLTMVSKFHTYSYRNTMLILRENPNATRVAGYNKWKELGRQVQRGEAGIPIIVPKGIQKWKAEIPKQNEFGQPVKNADGSVQLEEVEMESIQFGVAYVFDVSQTDGEPLPELGQNKLTGEVPETYLAAIRKLSPYPIRFDSIGGDTEGYCSFLKEEIVIDDSLSPAQTVSVALHEMAHAYLHADRSEHKSRQQREVEAESVSYILANALQVDSSIPSFEYIASWARHMEPEKLESVLISIHDQAHSLLTRLEQTVTELTAEKEVQIQKTAELPENKTEQKEKSEKPESFETRLNRATKEATQRNNQRSILFEKSAAEQIRESASLPNLEIPQRQKPERG